MIIANTSSGGAFHFDIRKPADHARLATLLGTGTITALAIHHAGQQSVLPLPRRFRGPVVYGAELLRNKAGGCTGERIFAHVADTRATLTLSYSNRMLRCDLERVGRMRYNPTSKVRSNL